jgi:hypothetical protein
MSLIHVLSDGAAVPPADLEERFGDPLQAARTGGIRRSGEDVAAGTGRVLECRQRRMGCSRVPFGKIAHPRQLGLLLFLGGGGELSGSDQLAQPLPEIWPAGQAAGQVLGRPIV